jgi:hypothetical protein
MASQASSAAAALQDGAANVAQAGAHGEAVDMSLSEALNATDCLVLRALTVYNIVGPLPTGSLNPSSLPLKPLDVSNPNPISHFFDILSDYDGTAAGQDGFAVRVT